MTDKLQQFRERIIDVLDEVRTCIDNGLIQMDLKKGEEREKNKKFLQTYMLKSEDRFKYISKLTYTNLCQLSDEKIKDHSIYDDLYIFGLKKKLIEKETGKEKDVEIYIKLQLYKLPDSDKNTLVVSFHEAEHPMQYFKWK